MSSVVGCPPGLLAIFSWVFLIPRESKTCEWFVHLHVTGDLGNADHSSKSTLAKKTTDLLFKMNDFHRPALEKISSHSPL